jgi:AraC-like DNA-binding protein
LQQYYLAAAGLSEKQLPKESARRLPAQDQLFVEKVHEAVLLRLDDYDLKVQDIAEVVYLSHSQLHRKLKALTGLSTNRFIRSVRLQKARQLLEEPDRSITSIAFDTGFQHPDYFAKMFQKEFGKTPSEYREHFHSGHFSS